MNTLLMPVKESLPRPASPASCAAAQRATASAAKLRIQTLLAVPLASAIAIGIHLAVRKNDPEPDTTSWLIFLSSILGLSLVMSVAQLFSCALRRWMAHMCPIIAAALGLFCLWDLITS